MNTPRIAVLLSTFNGKGFLQSQLDSLLSQTIPFDLYVRDDGSNDTSVSILSKFMQSFKKGRINIDQGQNIGVIQSFGFLVNQVRNAAIYDYIAFCDQDDIWKPNKLEVAISYLKNLETESGKSTPLLYHSDLDLLDANGNSMGKTFWTKMHLDPINGNRLNRILCQPTVTGCTVVINKTLLDAIKYFPSGTKMHDWWLALYAVCKGKVFSDKNSYIGYRQHSNNVIGSTGFDFGRIKKTLLNWSMYVQEWKKQNQERINQAESFLNEFRTELSIEQIEILEKFISIRDKSFFHRKIIQFQYGFFQQSALRLVSSILLF